MGLLTSVRCFMRYLCKRENIMSSLRTKLYNNENVYLSKHGGGAGNNWAAGYKEGASVQVRTELRANFRLIDGLMS